MLAACYQKMVQLMEEETKLPAKELPAVVGKPDDWGDLDLGNIAPSDDRENVDRRNIESQKHDS